jgi:hypothetical protein
LFLTDRFFINHRKDELVKLTYKLQPTVNI